jgi:hypothetical protein
MTKEVTITLRQLFKMRWLQIVTKANLKV